MPPVPTYQQAYDQTAGVYQPQTNLIQSQIDALPGQEQATLSSLDQAKANAFKSIDQSANAKGMLFSGFSPDQQAQYVGTKYLPAYAEAKTATANAKTSLLGKINDINFQRSQAAQGTVNAAQTAADKAAAASAKAATAGPTSAQKAASLQSDASSLKSYLDPLRGKDKYLSPSDYNSALSAWVQDGYTKAQFDSIFGYYKNPNQPKNQYQ